jgi:hypothetical protein
MPSFRRAHDDAAARQALADIVVGVADQVERDAMGEERTEGLAGRARELDRDGVVRQALVAVRLATSPDSMAPADGRRS